MVILPQLLRNSRQPISAAVPGIRKVSGSVSAPLFPDIGNQFMAGAIGADVVTGAGAPYTHTIDPANVLPSFSLEKNMDGADIQYSGMLVSKVELDLATNAEAKAVYTFEGQQDAVLGSPGTPAFPTDIPFGPTGITATLASYPDLTVSSVKATIDNSAKPYPTFNGEDYPDVVIGTTRKVSYDIVAFLQSVSGSAPPNYYHYLTDAPSLAFQVALVQGTSTWTLNSTNCVLTKYADPIKLGDVVMVNFTLTAMLDNATGRDLELVIVNSQATPYV